MALGLERGGGKEGGAESDVGWVEEVGGRLSQMCVRREGRVQGLNQMCAWECVVRGGGARIWCVCM